MIRRWYLDRLRIGSRRRYGLGRRFCCRCWHRFCHRRWRRFCRRCGRGRGFCCRCGCRFCRCGCRFCRCRCWSLLYCHRCGHRFCHRCGCRRRFSRGHGYGYDNRCRSYFGRWHVLRGWHGGNARRNGHLSRTRGRQLQSVLRRQDECFASSWIADAPRLARDDLELAETRQDKRAVGRLALYYLDKRLKYLARGDFLDAGAESQLFYQPALCINRTWLVHCDYLAISSGLTNLSDAFFDFVPILPLFWTIANRIFVLNLSAARIRTKLRASHVFKQTENDG